jgi:hypothetical protein
VSLLRDEHHPWVGLAVRFAVGVLIGWILGEPLLMRLSFFHPILGSGWARLLVTLFIGIIVAGMNEDAWTVLGQYSPFSRFRR